MMRISRNRTVLFHTAAVGALLCATPSFAQDASALPKKTTAQVSADIAQTDAVDADIVVTGTAIRGTAPVGSNLISLGQADIQAAGIASSTQLLSSIPLLGQFGWRPRQGGSPTTPVDIRGIGANATLVLFNSHRTVGIGNLQSIPDPSYLPVLALERVEVVPDGASAIYGSDAVAGVVNFVYRKNFNGIQGQATYGFGQQWHEVSINLLGGRKWDTGSFLVGYQYTYNPNLHGSDRPYDTLDLRSRGGIDARSSNAPIPNIVYNGVSYAGPNFAPNTTNLFDPTQVTDIVAQTNQHSVISTFRQELGSNVELFADATYFNVATSYRTPQVASSFTITNANPFFRAPPGTGATSETVNESFENIFGPRYNSFSLESITGSGGLRYTFGRDWQLEGQATYGHSNTISRLPDINQALFDAALVSTNPATALDPFSGRTSPATLANIYSRAASANAKQSLVSGTVKLDGSLFKIGGSDAKIAVGGEVRSETFDGRNENALQVPGQTTFVPIVGSSDRTVVSGFAELNLPLISPASDLSFTHSLTVTGAVRYDHYSDFGATTNPKFGVNWEPVEGVKIRGSYGTSFHAPSLADKTPIDARVDSNINVIAPGFLAPVGVNTPQNVYVKSGGSPSLKPETANTYSVGFEIAPKFIPRLKLSATYFGIEYSNLIGQPLYSGLYSNPALAQYYLLNPTQAQVDSFLSGFIINGTPIARGAVNILIDTERTNLGTRNINGIDYSATYGIDTTSAGRFTLGFSGVLLTHSTQSGAPGGASSDQFKTGQTIKSRFRATVGWNIDAFDANLFFNHIGTFLNPGVNPAQRVKPFNTVDANISIKLSKWIPIKEASLLINVENLFDANPPFYNGSSIGPTSGFNIYTASPIGRVVRVGLRTTF